jgi:predicted aminopeptidase
MSWYRKDGLQVMTSNPQMRGRWRTGAVALIAICAAVLLSGCRTVGFYAQAIQGQCQMVLSRKSVEKLLADTDTPINLKERLEFTQTLRAFAQHQLKLPIDDHYRDYVDLHREFVTWNVEAAPEFSMEPKTWWYPIVGSLDYRGYFKESDAKEYGRYLSGRGLDVCCEGAIAYSTLGWFKDPLLNTFVFEPDASVAETLFHELGHQVAFAHGDTDFNEAFATTVGQEGTRRWLRAKNDQGLLASYETGLKRNMEFVGLVMQTRRQLESLYGDTREDGGNVRASRQSSSLTADQLRAGKYQVITQMRRRYNELKISWGGSDAYDGWFALPINNARLNSVAAYYDLVPGFERLLEDNQGDLEGFYAAARRLAKTPRHERQQVLRNLAPHP